ncbi:hypothetical protein HY468_01185 [Candidatus Roizmanbacteria bacterium]|nr:hypothetical protein [Candidatus Roizmanbacteria bacterium]
MFEKLIQLKDNKWVIRGSIGMVMVLVGILYIISFDSAAPQSTVSPITPIPTPTTIPVSTTILSYPTIGPFTEELPLNHSYSFDEALPYETDSFTIVYPEFDIYTVYVKTGDSAGVTNSVESWFRSRSVDPHQLKIRYVTQTDEEMIASIISKLPVETDRFRIDFSPKMELFIVTLKGSSVGQSKQDAFGWFASAGLTDTTKINIRIGEAVGESQ